MYIFAWWLVLHRASQVQAKRLKKMVEPRSYMLPFLLAVVSLNKFKIILCYASADPTYGFRPVALTPENLELQRPYDVPLEERYSYENGVHKLWVYADDKPHDPNSPTQPRTEIRIRGLDYSSGVWQFEGYGFVPNGTSGATIAQIHGAAHGATTLILRIYNGDMRYYSFGLVATDLYDKWFRLNIIHDVDGGMVTVFIDGVKRFATKDKGPGDLYFKCGVYAAPANISYYMESRWRDIKIFKKCESCT